MPHEFPIEQLARSTQTRFQIGFARMTMRLMPAFEDIVLEPGADGLRILGANEMALTGPAIAIRRMHAGEVALEEPRVRMRYERELREPVMCLRAKVDPEHVEAAIRDLVARKATIESVDWLRAPGIVQAQAPLRNLLGYPQALATLSQGRADLKMWLSHYAPVPPDSGNDAA